MDAVMFALGQRIRTDEDPEHGDIQIDNQWVTRNVLVHLIMSNVVNEIRFDRMLFAYSLGSDTLPVRFFVDAV